MTRLGRLTQLCVLLALGAVFGWLGPFGTFGDLAALPRFAYWMLALPLIGLPASLAIRAVARTGAAAHWPLPAQALLGALIAALPSTLVIIALESLFRLTPPPSTYAFIYASVALVIAVIGIPQLIIARRDGAPERVSDGTDGNEGKAAPGGSAFLRRIPAKLGTNLLYLEMEDHYLRIHTEVGSDLILLRLSDAVAELDPALGARVHRSFWVARRAVAKVERNGHRASLVLTTGTRIPVSRTYRRTLRKAGWL